MESYNIKGLENLAIGVVTQAAKDYENALRNNNEDEIKRLERFFRSSYYATLTNVDGEYLIQQIQEKAKKPRTKKDQIRVVVKD